MIFRGGFPVYRQHDAMDCGPACLRMVARHHGMAISMQDLRQRSHSAIDGVSLAGLHDAAASLGFEASCVLCSLDYLAGDAPLPCIVHWDNSHFVVVYRIDRDRAFVADPACGRVAYPIDVFLSHWAAAADEGYALLLKPTDEFHARREVTHSRRGMLFLLSYLKPYRRLLAHLSAAMLLGSLLQLAFPFLTAAIVDKGIVPGDIPMLQVIFAGQLILVVSRASVSYVRAWTLFCISAPLNITLVHDFLVKLAKLPLGFFDTKLLGDALQRINDHQRVETFLTHSVLNFFLTVLNIIVFGIVLAIYNVTILALFLTGTVLYLAWIRMFLARRREIDFARFRLLGKSQNRIIQFIMGMQELRLNNCESRTISNWAGIQSDLFSINRRGVALTRRQQMGCSLLQEVQGLVITYLAACSVIDGGMTLGMMLALQFILGQLTGPVEQLVQLTATAQDAAISFERIEEVRSLPDEEDPRAPKTTDFPKAADIILSNVSFRYGGPHSESVLSDVSLTFPGGKVTAIVGASGSGKTTLVRLLLGVYPPLAGAITIGGVPMPEISLRSWRSACGLVMQDGYLFSDTIAANIALTDGTIDDDRVEQAAHLANIDEFIRSLPLGYKTLIGADGHGLSQGQKQRILIARAVYKNPDYLFLDEATNALDANNESTVMGNLASCFGGKTVVIIAHRLSTIRGAHRIIVLDHGAVIETGTHAELTARQGFYYGLVKGQLEPVTLAPC